MVDISEVLTILQYTYYKLVDPGKSLNLELMFELERQPSNNNLPKNLLSHQRLLLVYILL
ncbi:MAG: hypothetical protein QXW79_00040 [Thermoplasmata archaeon]